MRRFLAVVALVSFTSSTLPAQTTSQNDKPLSGYTRENSQAQRQWEQGYWAVKYAVAKNQGHTIPMDHETGSRIITQQNLSN